ncbi:MAG: amino acid ABC transporter permease [Tepidanaerobacteraceae bacterium]|nr:amino acid ABC transporter permease [Tepidanaerobacteraceae bacterium]
MGISDKAYKVLSSIPYLLSGVGITLEITVIALMLGTAIGLFLALGRVYGNGVVRRFVIFYSRIIRSLPLLVILFMLYFLGSEIIDIPAFWAVILALAIHTSAYQSEIFRGAIQSISMGQMEAALALGMSKYQGIFAVILPQSLRRAIPYWANEATIVLKDSALAYVLGITELMRRGEYVSARTSQPLLTYIVVGLIYLILTYAFTKSMARVESRARIPGLER